MYICICIKPLPRDNFPTLYEKGSGFFYVHRVLLSYTRDRRLKVSSERLGSERNLKLPCPEAINNKLWVGSYRGGTSPAKPAPTQTESYGVAPSPPSRGRREIIHGGPTMVSLKLRPFRGSGAFMMLVALGS